MRNLSWWLFAMVLLIAGFLQSCSTLEKKIEKAKGVMTNNPNEFAGLAGTLYPPQTVYVKGKDSVITETKIEEKIVKVPVVIKGDTVYVYVKCPETKVITKTLYRVDTLKTSNSAKELFLANALIKSDQMYSNEKLLLERAEKEAKSRLWIMFGLIALLLGLGYLFIRK